MPAETHDPKAIMVLWDGLRIEGFTADGIATVERLQEAETEVGADGRVVVTRPSANAKIVVLTMFPNSPGYKILADTFAEETAQRGALPVHSYHQEDMVSGDMMSDPSAVMIQGPIQSHGASAGAREFRILLPDPQEEFGGNIVA